MNDDNKVVSCAQCGEYVDVEQVITNEQYDFFCHKCFYGED